MTMSSCSLEYPSRVVGLAVNGTSGQQPASVHPLLLGPARDGPSGPDTPARDGRIVRRLPGWLHANAVIAALNQAGIHQLADDPADMALIQASADGQVALTNGRHRSVSSCLAIRNPWDRRRFPAARAGGTGWGARWNPGATILPLPERSSQGTPFSSQ